MDFQQKRMATHTWFTFDEKELGFRVRDNSGDVEFSVEYSAIPPSKRSVFERNNWLRNVGFIWCALGVINVGLALAGSRALTGSAFWLFIGLGCLAFYRATWSEYTVIDTDEGSIWILKDKQHDDIIAAIKDKRKTQLLAWYNSLDFSDDPKREIQTVEWLVKREAISKTDGKARIAEIRGAQTILLSSPDGDETDRQIH